MYKKLLCFLSLFTLLLLLISKSAFAFDQFIKYEKNPLKFDTTIIQDNNRLAPFVLFENGQYKMWYSSIENNQIAYATSYNGIDWKIEKLIDILNDSPEENPSLIKTADNKYRLFFTGIINGAYHIYQTILKNEYEVDNPQSTKLVLSPLPSSTWEYNSVADPYIFSKNNKLYLFYTAHSYIWRLGLAISEDDGNTWTRCPQPIFSSIAAAGPLVFENENRIYLIYHDPFGNGFFLTETSNELSCNSSWTNPTLILERGETYDNNHLTSPSLIKVENNFLFYYSGLGTKWNINLASTQPVKNFFPFILLPGLMASWNGKAIIHNQEVSIFDWKIPSFVKEYTGIITSLKNLGYQVDQDFFVFPYDWRKPVEQTTVDLNTFLQQKIWQQNPNQKVNLIGHSLGGLVARIFAQKNKDKVNQIISVGSPHQGAVQVYKPLEAGEIDRENTFLWLAQKLILVLNKSTIEPDRETIKKRFPVALDLFPTFNFLKDKNGQEIPIDSLSIKNNTLLTYNPTFSQIFDIFTAIYGEKDEQTPAGYKIESPSVLDQLLGNYIDGKPIDIWYEKGDYTVLSKSANQDSDSKMLNFDHGEIITEKESIKKIFDTLHIGYSDDKIVSGQKTKISPSLIFLIHSPAKMKVLFNGQTFEEEDGIIFIPEAQEGNYHLQVQGTNLGKYTVIVGQISQNNDLWEKIEGEITKTPPESQIDSYLINFNPQTANSIFPTPTPTNFISPTPQPSSTPTPTTTVSPNPNTTPTPTPTKTSSLTPTTTQSSTQNQTTNPTSNLTSSYNNQSISLSPSPTSVLFSSIKNQSSKEEVMGEKTKDEVKKIEEKPTPKKNNSSSIEIAIPIVVSLISLVTLIIKKKILKKVT
jgi:pimeloyl-ACP methyl ester carboxylesterase